MRAVLPAGCCVQQLTRTADSGACMVRSTGPPWTQQCHHWSCQGAATAAAHARPRWSGRLLCCLTRRRSCLGAHAPPQCLSRFLHCSPPQPASLMWMCLRHRLVQVCAPLSTGIQRFRTIQQAHDLDSFCMQLLHWKRAVGVFRLAPWRQG